MQKAKIFVWNEKVVPLSDANNLVYSLQEIQQSKEFNSLELKNLSDFSLKDLQFFVQDVNLPDYDDFVKLASEVLDKNGELTSKELKDELRTQDVWITQKTTSDWIKKFAKDKKLKEEKISINGDPKKYYVLYKEDIQPDPKGSILIL